MRSLREADAAEIALEWAMRLTAHAGDCLQLTSVHNALLPVLDVTVESHTDGGESFAVDKQALAALRETLGVWCALSCCRGFGGYKNPRFWDAMVRRFVKNYDPIEEMGWYKFHNEAATPSRVTLKIYVRGRVSLDGSDKQQVCDWMRSVCRELFQLHEYTNAMSLSAEYQDTLQHLRPYIDERRFAREAIMVELVFDAWKPEVHERTDVAFLQTLTPILNEIAAQKIEIGGRTLPVDAPVLRVQDVDLECRRISTNSELQAFISALARNPFPVSEMCPSIRSKLDPTMFSNYVTTILQAKELSETSEREQIASPGKVQALMFLLRDANRHSLACFFSALPFTKSLRRLRLDEFKRGAKFALTKWESSWLAYACFHPRSKTSPWNDLQLDPSSLADDGREVLQDIIDNPTRALSITRLAVMAGVVSASDARSDDRLQIATVNEHAKIYVRSSVDADILITLGEKAEHEMCDLHSSDWHCVLVPGYGFGWVQQDDVTGTRKWILEGSVCSSLKVFEVPSAFGVEDGLLLLSAIGSSIETLTLSKRCASRRFLVELMLTCPNLKSLALEVEEDQIFPAKSVNSSGYYAPELLEILTTQTDSEAVKRVKKLRLSNFAPRKFSRAQVASLEAILLVNPSIEQLLITEGFCRHSWDMRTPGAELEKYHGELLHRSELLKQRWAFLSVTKHRSSTPSHLDSEVIAVIFEFATSRVRRLVHLSPFQRNPLW